MVGTGRRLLFTGLAGAVLRTRDTESLTRRTNLSCGKRPVGLGSENVFKAPAGTKPTLEQTW